MKKHTLIIVFLLISSSCKKDILTEDTNEELFQMFWEIINERYVYHEEKNLNWDSIYTEYKPRFKNNMSDEAVSVLFEEIINYIKDYHVYVENGYYAGIFHRGIHTHIVYDYDKLFGYYNMDNIRETEELCFAQLPNSVLYLRIKRGIKQKLDISSIEELLKSYKYSKGIVIDLRNDSGGHIYGLEICSLFFSGDKTIYYVKDKTGQGHSDFSVFKAITMNGRGTIPDTIPLIMLANINTYSLGNLTSFVLKDLTDCTFIGQETGGGGSTVAAIFLPKGWALNFSANKLYNLSKKMMETGLEPDIEIIPEYSFWHLVHNETGEDTQLETAIEYLQNIK